MEMVSVVNMTKLAESYGLDYSDIDTYGIISKEDLKQKHAEGYELYQRVYPDNTHAGFVWKKKK